MKKRTLGNFISFFIGTYFLVRAYFWYNKETGNIEENHFYALVFASIGLLAIIIQLIANYIKKNKKE